MRAYMRDINLGREPRPEIPASVGMGEELMYEMYRLLAIAKYEARYVIPTAYAADGHRLEETVTECSLDFEGGPGMYPGPGRSARPAANRSRWRSRRSRHSRNGRPPRTSGVGAARPSRVNLLNWDGKGSPPRRCSPPGPGRRGLPSTAGRPMRLRRGRGVLGRVNGGWSGRRRRCCWPTPTTDQHRAARPGARRAVAVAGPGSARVPLLARVEHLRATAVDHGRPPQYAGDRSTGNAGAHCS